MYINVVAIRNVKITTRISLIIQKQKIKLKQLMCFCTEEKLKNNIFDGFSNSMTFFFFKSINQHMSYNYRSFYYRHVCFSYVVSWHAAFSKVLYYIYFLNINCPNDSSLPDTRVGSKSGGHVVFNFLSKSLVVYESFLISILLGVLFDINLRRNK